MEIKAENLRVKDKIDRDGIFESVERIESRGDGSLDVYLGSFRDEDDKPFSYHIYLKADELIKIIK